MTNELLPAAGPYGIMVRLKGETQDAHRQAEKVAFQRELVEGSLPREIFSASLPQLQALRRGLETNLEEAAAVSTEVASVFESYHKFSHLYDLDIAAVGASRGAEPVAAIVRFHAKLKGWCLEDPRLLLGAFYVLEGSNMGAAMIRKRVAVAYGFLDGLGTAAMFPHGTQLMERWKKFGGAMNALPLETEVEGRIVEVARQTFTAVGQIYEEIYKQAGAVTAGTSNLGL